MYQMLFDEQDSMSKELNSSFFSTFYLGQKGQFDVHHTNRSFIGFAIFAYSLTKRL